LWERQEPSTGNQGSGKKIFIYIYKIVEEEIGLSFAENIAKEIGREMMNK
jgi:hypothetical protein